MPGPAAGPAAAGQELLRPWIQDFVVMPAAALAQPPAGLQRKRPFIYVYDMPEQYTGRMLQFRVDKCAPAFPGRAHAFLRLPAHAALLLARHEAHGLMATCCMLHPTLGWRRGCRGTCTWRQWGAGNVTDVKSQGYVLEQLLHEVLLQSSHR
jgi:hypothetical protein